MSGYMLIASGIGLGIILMIVAAKLYERLGRNGRGTPKQEKLFPTPNQGA